MKPGIIIIIMIHSELHNHFSLINVTALLSLLKAAASSINLTVHKNSLGNNNFLVDVAHTHLHTLWAQGGTLQLKIQGGGGTAGSIVWGLRFWLEKIFWGSSKILIWTIVRG